MRKKLAEAVNGLNLARNTLECLDHIGACGDGCATTKDGPERETYIDTDCASFGHPGAASMALDGLDVRTVGRAEALIDRAFDRGEILFR